VCSVTKAIFAWAAHHECRSALASAAGFGHSEAVAREEDGPVGGVGETAVGAAEMRAEESLRPDRLFEDPYAAAFVAAAPPLFPDLPEATSDPEIAALKDAFFTDVVIRTRFYDEYVTTACAHGCRQVVLLAAGLDTRAYRLSWPHGTQVFELDLPEVLAFKQRVLEAQAADPRCTRVALAVDLRDDWATQLRRAGFDDHTATAWLAEGILAYLPNHGAERLLSTVSELSATGSQLACEHNEFADDSTLSSARAIPAMRQLTSMWDGGLNQDTAEWLRHRHWTVDTYHHAGLANRYGRQAPTHSGTDLLTATVPEKPARP
jgi:methyltransferase (TIGR00027 family)